jgi:predicted protein tyrosine phosphatase
LIFATVPLSETLLRWADAVVVMGHNHENLIREKFESAVGEKPVFCLDIQDRYRYMDNTLISLIENKMTPVLESLGIPAED